MTTSETINEIAAALSKAQGAMRPAAKDATNPHFKSKYADLASVMEACRGPLSTNGLCGVQDVTLTERGIAVITRLCHASGQWMEFGPLTVPLGKADAHGVGSATTYAKRYALSAALGIASDEDDDGNAAKAQAFDESGYQGWIGNLALCSTYPELLETVKAGPQAFQEALRADKSAWLKLKNAVAVPA